MRSQPGSRRRRRASGAPPRPRSRESPRGPGLSAGASRFRRDPPRGKRVQIRPARAHDTETLAAFDAIAQHDPSRVPFIHSAIASDTCFVAEVDERVVAYGVLDHRFYDQAFVSMLYVHRDFRRRGIASALMAHMERQCRTGKLFTSTNRSNSAMQALLMRRGYQPSGIIENLNEGDPEVVYVKHLGRDTV